MLAKSLLWAIIAVVFLGTVWWFTDPVGFSNNPLLIWTRLLMMRAPAFGH